MEEPPLLCRSGVAHMVTRIWSLAQDLSIRFFSAQWTMEAEMLFILRAVSVQCNYDSTPPIDCWHVAPNRRLLPPLPVPLLSIVDSDYVISIWHIVQNE